MVLNQLFERPRIVAENLRVANLVVGIGNRARLSLVAIHIFVKQFRLRNGNAIEVVDQVFWPVKRRMWSIEPQEHAAPFAPLRLDPLDGLASKQRVDILTFIQLRRLVVPANSLGNRRAIVAVLADESEVVVPVVV